MAAAKEISKDAATAAVLSELGNIFLLKGELKNGTEGFSLRTACFLFTPDWLNILLNIAAHGGR